MTNERFALLCSIGLVLCPPSAPAAGQDVPDPIQEIVLVDGSTLYGVIVDDGDPVHVRLVSGDEIFVARGRVRTISRARGRLEDGEFWREDPNLTRLFFAPTARTMPKGDGYLAAYELMFPFVAAGLTDRLLVAGGTPLFGDLDSERVVYLAPKLRVFTDDRTDFAVGGFFFHELGDEFSSEAFGALYGVLTRGTADRAVSLAVGAGYDDDGFFDEAVVMLGAEVRVSRTIKLITENYLVPDLSLFSFGPRFFGERLSADLGIGMLVVEGEFVTLPIVNFVYVW